MGEEEEEEEEGEGVGRLPEEERLHGPFETP